VINIQEDIDIKDHWPLQVFAVGPGREREMVCAGTDYVLLRNASLRSKHISLASVNGVAALSAELDYTVICARDASAFVIRYPGLRLTEQRFFVQSALEAGGLSYMDGGTNSTALHPNRCGEPVVNYVHFPAGMVQTLHTHPSHRIGLVLQGNGRIELNNKKFFAVEEGSAFFMQRNELHNFITDDEPVILFVFAPDSGTGPTDEMNALKVRTYLGATRHER